ncbi:MAG: uroporphyrinogen-III synthase [Betaproteobacteria bacterium]|nr:MAG: uroporphyrinogen-III synthase [Betaproteobacteria bacterium]
MKGKRIAVLEARLGRQLAELVAQRGGVPFHAPALAELPDLEPAKIAALVQSLEQRPAKLAVFQTGVGTRALFSATDGLGVTARFLALLEKSTVVVRGPKPTAALRSRGVRIDRAAAEPFTTHEILAAIENLELHGTRVIVQRYGTVNAELEAALASRGAEVVEIPTYRWSLPQDTGPLAELIGALERGEMDAAVFTNAEQVRNLFLVAQNIQKTEALRDGLNATLVASIGPVASAALRDAQVKIGVEARPPKLGALLSALEAALA